MAASLVKAPANALRKQRQQEQNKLGLFLFEGGTINKWEWCLHSTEEEEIRYAASNVCDGHTISTISRKFCVFVPEYWPADHGQCMHWENGKAVITATEAAGLYVVLVSFGCEDESGKTFQVL